MASIEELEAQVEALKQQAAQCTSDIRSAQKRAKREAGQCHVAVVLQEAGEQQEQPKLCQGVATKLVLLMQLADYDFGLVVSYSLGQGRPARCQLHGLNAWDPEVRRCIRIGLELLFLGVDMGVLESLWESSTQKMVQLAIYIVEHKLYHWLVELNCQKGVAPGSSQLQAQAIRIIPAKVPAAVGDVIRARYMAGGRSCRYWISSFKLRWGVKAGLLQTGEEVKPDQLQSKVSWTCLAIFILI